MTPGRCPHCGRVAEAVTDVSGGESVEPEAGAFSVCIMCLGVAVFTGRGLELREATPAELAAAAEDEDVRTARRICAAWHVYRAAVGRYN